MQIAVTWALAIVAMCLTDMSRIDLGTTIAGAIASSIVLVIMFVIGCIPIIGQILQQIIWMIDYFISAICGWLPEDMQETDAANWFCGGLEGIVSNIIQNLIYAGNVMVDLKERDLEPGEKNRIEFISMDLNDLVFPDQGIREGNGVLVGLTISNTIDMISLPANIGGAYPYQYSDSNLKSSTFSLQAPGQRDRLPRRPGPQHDEVRVGVRGRGRTEVGRCRPHLESGRAGVHHPHAALGDRRSVRRGRPQPAPHPVPVGGVRHPRAELHPGHLHGLDRPGKPALPPERFAGL